MTESSHDQASELQRRLAEIELAHEQTVLYARDLHQVFQAERERTRELQVAIEELQTTYDATLDALVRALDARDHETEGHSRRVTEFSVAIARALGIGGAELVILRRGAILHDIGKLGVPDAILRKPGPLTDQEWHEMRRHPELGYRILQGIGFLEPAAQIVLHHHERFDGKGYPRSLPGVGIAFGARIFAVADTFDAMTSHRPYRVAVADEIAIAEIKRQRERQFDPDVVDAFLRIVDDLRRIRAELNRASRQ